MVVNILYGSYHETSDYYYKLKIIYIPDYVGLYLYITNFNFISVLD